MNRPRDLPLRSRIAPVLDDQVHIGERLSRPGLGRLVQGRGRYVDDLLVRHNGNVTHAARASGIAHRYFQLLRARSR